MPALTLDRIDKWFGAVRALDDVTLAFERGEIHAVLGENGAGKSTLLRIAAGRLKPDAGRVTIGGTRLEPHTPREASRRGVAIVEQHFALVGAFSALDNVMLGAEPTRSLGRLDRAAALARATAVADPMAMTFSWRTRVDDLAVGERQRLEIVRALVRDAHVLILDEPTAVLTPPEAAALYGLLRRLAASGRAVVVVTHRLDEVESNADRVTVLRHGKLVSTRSLEAADEATRRAVLREAMGDGSHAQAQRSRKAPSAVHSADASTSPSPNPHLGEDRPIVLSMHGVRLGRALNGVDLVVRAGEIVGVAGVDGNGQDELVRVLAGRAAADAGVVTAESVAVTYGDRHADGLVLGASVEDNLVLGELAAFTRFGLVDRGALRKAAQARFESGRVAGASLDSIAATLSGGNQQRIVMARAIARAERATALVVAQPTRGVDLAGAREIHGQLLEAAEAGKAVLVVSSDVSELRALCDRILVMTRGRIVADLSADVSDAVLGEAMLVGSPDRQSA